MRSLRLAFRTLTRTPFVTTIAVASLALGIGANAAIFSMFDQFLLQPVRAVEPGRLVNLGAPGPKPGSQSCNQAGDCDEVFSYRMFRDLEVAASPVLSGLAAHVAFRTNISFRKETRNAQGMLVSGSYFPTLGVQPTMGRLLTPADDEGIARWIGGGRGLRFEIAEIEGRFKLSQDKSAEDVVAAARHLVRREVESCNADWLLSFREASVTAPVVPQGVTP